MDVAALTSQGDTVACVGSAPQSRFRASHRLQLHFTWEASAQPQLTTLREANRTQLFLLARPTQKKKLALPFLLGSGTKQIQLCTGPSGRDSHRM